MEPGDRLPDAEEIPGSGHRQRLEGHARTRAHSRYIHVKQELHERGTPEPPSPTIELRLPASYIYIYIKSEGSLGSIVGGSGVRTRIILVLRECIWNVLLVSLSLSAFDDTSSLRYPPHHVVYSLSVSTMVTSRFLYGE